MCVSLILSFIPLKTGSPISKLVLLKLADNADARGVCFPSLNYLAQYCEVSVRTVKRHVNELEKQGFVKRIKRFDDSGRQRSNIYQLRLPSDSHIQQTDLGQANQENANVEQTGLPSASSEYPQKTEHAQKTDHSDTPLGDSRSNTESDHPAHIIFHKEHKTELSLKNGILDDTDVLEPPSGSKEHEGSAHQATTTPISQQNEAVIHLLTTEGSAPIYHEFTTILERTYPKLDVLQELYAMQAWLYINPDKRKPFEHIGHFVNGWLRRSAQAKAKRDLSPFPHQTRAAKQARAGKPATTKEAKLQEAMQAIDSAKEIQAAKPMEPKQPTPVSQALADYKAKSTTNPFEARIKALVQSKSPGTDSKQ
ncbi:helix-turn-helix domain-containing protein [Vibrio splendidus]|uniref:helix-turn-helix domain-containing protein n=1 Tax=Vibrio splendidus TaxID=29497 RepID=UPI000D3C2276|nr:helix-turn-helix domain-containing protein [Vibrio splendidus]PTP42201.1 helix-turn-helix domain-containing protein [Vibrio splendidus]